MSTHIAPLTLSPSQHDFVYSSALYALFAGGIATGKTYAGALRSFNYASSAPSSYGLIGAPSFGELTRAKDQFFAITPSHLIIRHSRPENAVTLTNGAKILFRCTEDYNVISGLALSWFWLDNVHRVTIDYWHHIKHRLRQDTTYRSGWGTGNVSSVTPLWKEFVATSKHHLIPAAPHLGGERVSHVS